MTSPLSPAQEKAKLRKSIRSQRRQLSKLQQKKASNRLIANLRRHGLLLRGKHIALYLGSDGEICPKSLIILLKKWKKRAYLPVIHPLKPQEIVFCQVTPSTRYTVNRFGIKEPDLKFSPCISPRHLSMVLMPLVAFDDKGNRMGMGGGFYDRAFEFKLDSPLIKPRLIGLAHELQKQATLPTNTWDVALDAIVTDQHFYKNSARHT